MQNDEIASEIKKSQSNAVTGMQTSKTMCDDEVPIKSYTEKDAMFAALIQSNVEVKDAVERMQSAISRSAFKDVIRVGIQIKGDQIFVHRYYVSIKRVVNRVRAYAWRYSALVPYLETIVISAK